MKRFAAVIFTCATLLAVVAAAQTARAQSAESLSDEQIGQIRQNCVKAQTTLNQLHVTDAGLRNNRGSLYELISNKLMAPLNSRIALNRMGGLKLAATTLEYDKQFANFSVSYRQYYDAMLKTLRINCVNQPVEFYESVAATREKRQKLHDNIASLNTLLQTYRSDFEDFAKESQKDTK